MYYASLVYNKPTYIINCATVIFSEVFLYTNYEMYYYTMKQKLNLRIGHLSL